MSQKLKRSSLLPHHETLAWKKSFRVLYRKRSRSTTERKEKRRENEVEAKNSPWMQDV